MPVLLSGRCTSCDAQPAVLMTTVCLAPPPLLCTAAVEQQQCAKHKLGFIVVLTDTNTQLQVASISKGRQPSERKAVDVGFVDGGSIPGNKGRDQVIADGPFDSRRRAVI